MRIKEKFQVNEEPVAVNPNDLDSQISENKLTSLGNSNIKMNSQKTIESNESKSANENNAIKDNKKKKLGRSIILENQKQKLKMFKRRKSVQKLNNKKPGVMIDFSKYMPRDIEKIKKDTLNQLLVKEYEPNYKVTRKKTKTFKFKSLKPYDIYELTRNNRRAISNVELYLNHNEKKVRKVNVPDFKLNLGRETFSSSFYGKSNAFFLTGLKKKHEKKRKMNYSCDRIKNPYKRKYYFSVADVEDIMADNMKLIS